MPKKRATSPLYFKSLPSQPDLAKLEEQVLAYWKATDAFNQSVTRRDPKQSYVFYDGPPFATGLPHYGHLLGSTSKDVIPRYWTMKGYRVERVWGWDCHGLPIENMIEQKLEIKNGKKGIEELGIGTFNQACRAEVLRLDREWERIIERLGRWVDFAHNYKTMDATYMESVWWGFGELFDKGLVYEGKKVILYCPRCATPLSNFEIAMDNSYQDVQDPSVYIKFALTDAPDEAFLAWTTTPWTLPGNVGLAVDPKAQYVLANTDDGQKLWLAEERLQTVLGETAKVSKRVPGKELVGKSYTPLFPYLTEHQTKHAWTVLPAEFVSLEDGTGIVHTAAVFGEDDYQLALDYDLPLVSTLDDEGKFLPFVKVAAGQFYKKADATIIEALEKQGSLFKHETITHSYPFCYRCGTPLYYNAVPAWYINVQSLKPDLLAQNEQMHWYPKHLKHGRFGKGLQDAPDWNISRSRYWGTPMPIWEAPKEAAGNKPDAPLRRIIHSFKELEEWAVHPEQVAELSDYHREYLDSLEVWIDDAKTIKGKRIPEVFDCWVESGSMPFASKHYPFEHKHEFEATYPAQFVSEYIAQTRAWFYTMHVMSVGIFGKRAVENTLTTGTIMAADGTKMSKSKKNYPDPMKVIEQNGVDSLRLYLMSSPVMRSENINFNEKEVADIRKRVFLIWWNVLSFFRMYQGEIVVDTTVPPESEQVLDRWILSRLQTTHQAVESAMDAYDTVVASRALMEFVTELSTWYIRRSRDRIKQASTREVTLQVLGFVLFQLAQLFAPITPFFSELVAQNIQNLSESIHLSDWPKQLPHVQNLELEVQMQLIRKAAENIHAGRKDAGIKVRQPLATATVTGASAEVAEPLLAVLTAEVNVKQIQWSAGEGQMSVTLDTTLTAELRQEGEVRELIRSIQQLRKNAHLTPSEAIAVSVPQLPQEPWLKQVEETTNATLSQGTKLELL